MDVELKPSTEYEINGTVSGVTVEAWIENSSRKEKVSKIFKATYRRKASNPIPISITIPIR
jgi:hypothetical protein